MTTMKPAEVDALARQLSALTPVCQKRLLKALDPAFLVQVMRLLADRQGTGRIDSLSDLHATDIKHLTHFIAIGLDGKQTRVVFDLGRASAREAGRRLAGDERSADLTPNGAATALGISRTHLRHLMDTGVITFRKVGTHHRIHPAEVARVKAEWERRIMAMAQVEVASADIDT